MESDGELNLIDLERRIECEAADCPSSENLGGTNQATSVEENLDDNVDDNVGSNAMVVVGDQGKEGEDVECTPTKLGHVELGSSIPPPHVGMVFASMEDVDDYFRRYGIQQGFGVVRAASSTYRGKDSDRKARNALWTCDRYGKPKKKRKAEKKSLVTDSQIVEEESVKSSKKCECSAMIYASVNGEKEWQLRKVVLEHRNHNPTPSKARHLAVVRKQAMTAHVKRKLMLGSAAGLKVAQMHNLLAKERNGLEELVLTERDLRNEMDKEKRLKLEEGDAKAMLNYFDKMTAGNQNFFHTYRLDSEDKMQDILWVDARCRAAYEEFGDVVVFDTTYLTNKYHLPFANFVGVNHHGQTILLGCALISRETTKTFVWVFSKWLNCMNGRAPVGILTDQAAAMRRALSETMPETTHRWCIWHITSKFTEKLGKYKRYAEFKEELMRAIYDSMTPDEFVASWISVIEEYGLGENDWLNGLFEEREMWIPAYTKHLFWAGMKTTQRVESIHSFFDDYLNPSTRLREFAESYCEAMEFRAQSERDLDAHNEGSTLELQSDFAPEGVFQKCYTTAKFKEVQRECSRLGYLHCILEKTISENETEYTFEDRVWCRNKQTKRDFATQYRRTYSAVYNKSTNLVECECKLFNCNGIMCRHMIKLYDILKIFEVPENYILRRWRKDIQRKHTRIKVAYHDPSKTEHVRDYDFLQCWFDRICSRACVCKPAVRLLAELLEMMEIQVEEKVILTENELLSMTPSSVNRKGKDQTPCSTTGPASKRKASTDASGDVGLNDQDVERCTDDPSSQALVLKDPPLPRPKSLRTATRYQSVVEKAVNKLRTRAGNNAAKKQQSKTTNKGKKGKDVDQDDQEMAVTRSRSTKGRQHEQIPQSPPDVSYQVAATVQSGRMAPLAPPYMRPCVGYQTYPPPPRPAFFQNPTQYAGTSNMLALPVAFPRPYYQAQRVLFPPSSSDEPRSTHASNSPGTLDTNLKL